MFEWRTKVKKAMRDSEMKIQQSYRELVVEKVKMQDGSAIYNRSVEHAAVLIEHIFALAERTIYIVSGKLDPNAYGTGAVIQNFQQFLNKEGTKAKIIVEDLDEQSLWINPLLSSLTEEQKARVEFQIVPENIKQIYTFHFCIADGKHFRFEANRSNPVAVAAFSREAKGEAEHITALFDSLFDRLQEERSLGTE